MVKEMNQESGYPKHISREIGNCMGTRLPDLDMSPQYEKSCVHKVVFLEFLHQINVLGQRSRI